MLGIEYAQVLIWTYIDPPEDRATAPMPVDSRREHPGGSPQSARPPISSSQLGNCGVRTGHAKPKEERRCHRKGAAAKLAPTNLTNL